MPAFHKTRTGTVKARPKGPETETTAFVMRRIEANDRIGALMKPWGHRAAFLALLWSAAACALDDRLVDAAPPPPQQAAPTNQIETPPMRTPNFWVESFDHRGQIQTLEGSARVDSNRGVLDLQTGRLAELEAEGRVRLTPGDGLMGTIRADEVVLGASETLSVPDGLEIVAQSRVQIDGQLITGAGGLVIVAGETIEISGAIVSSGAITLVVTSPDGVIRINGRVLTRTSAGLGVAPPILLTGRGSVEIWGHLGVETYGMGGSAVGGRVRFDVYGDVTFTGPQPDLILGLGGRVEIESTGAVRFEEGTLVLTTATWSIGARALHLGTGAEVEAGGFSAVAEDQITLGEASALRMGGLEASLVAEEFVLGSGSEIIASGDGGSNLRIEAGTGMTADAGALVATFGPRCALGRLFVRVGGTYLGRGPARFRSAEPAPDCTASPSAEPTLRAQAFEGTAPELSAGEEAVLDSELRVPVPAIEARTAGRWLSRPIRIPLGAEVRIEQLLASIPEGTAVEISLGEADGPTDWGRNFVPLRDLAPPRTTDYSVVRIDLVGRRFDTPSVDHLVLTW